jgi:hypothetical protein
MDMHLQGWNKLICYCDKCAHKYNYPIKEKKEKGTCAFCRISGFINQVPQVDIVDIKDFNETVWEGGGFKVTNQIPFPIQHSHDKLYPTLSRRMINSKCLIFYDKDFLIVTNIKTGQQISIEFLE